jgi:hypothetical protein
MMNRIFISIVAILIPVYAGAQTLRQSQDGSRLGLELSCARSITVTADPGLSNRVALDARADHAEEIAEMAFTGGTEVTLKRHGGMFGQGECWTERQPGQMKPTLDVTLRVAPGFPISIDASGDTTYHVAVGGPLHLDISGSPHVDVTEVTDLTMDASGSGQARFGNVSGSVHLSLSGSGLVSVAHGQTQAVTIDASGSGSFTMDGGSVGKLAVSSSGSAKIEFGGRIETAAVALSGSGDVHIHQLTGALTQDISGSGTVQIASRTP